MIPVSSGAVRRFRDMLTTRLGLQFADERLHELADLLQARAGSGSVDAYLDALSDAPIDDRELSTLAGTLTVSETYFFRNMDQFRALEEMVLPDVAARAADRPLRVLSAGSASGEEAYSIAIVVDRARASRALPRVEIAGIDISPRVLERARRAHYSEWALRGTPDEIRRAYFQKRGRDYVLSPATAEAVRFEQRNLLDESPDLWRPAWFDVIFFRNTFMYFAPDAAQAVIDRATRALVPGGYLFVGHAETLRGLSDDFELVHTHNTFYYRRRTDRTARALPPGEALDTRPKALPLEDTAWFDTIGDASARIRHVVDAALAQVGTPQRDGPPAADPAPGDLAPRRLAATLALLGEERFDEALALLERSPQADADALLVRAVLLTNLGRFEEAARACDAVLRVHPLSAGAHYLLALQARHHGDLRRARQHDEAAIYLDRSFAMPHLHLGLIARHAGDAAGARDHLAAAERLLHREDPGRLLLFSGGFTREALLRLCQAELKQTARGAA
ncbi:MAG: CheR family methyltransferase [Vicinamibacterales bacterium]